MQRPWVKVLPGMAGRSLKWGEQGENGRRWAQSVG